MTLWFFDTAGIGSIIVFVIGFLVLLAYARMLRWIRNAPPDEAVTHEDGNK